MVIGENAAAVRASAATSGGGGLPRVETTTVTNRAGQMVQRIIAPMDFKLQDGEIEQMRPVFQRASDGQWRMR